MNEEVLFEVQNGTQESTILEEDLGCREPRREVGMVNDDFPNDCFEREEETMDDDDISDSSEEGGSEDESDEEDAEEQNYANAHATEALLGLSEVNLDGVQHDDVGGPSVNHTTFEREVHISRLPVNTRVGEGEHYTQAQYEFGLPSVRNDKDLSRIDRAICDSTMLFTEGIIFTTKPEIHEKMLFDSLDELKFFLADYAVKHYRPFAVVHSDRNLRYEVMCKQGCMWRVWARLQRGIGKWKITKVVEPHTCRSSQVKGVHAQLTASYIGRCILGVVRENSEVTASSLIEQILLFAGYRVKYSKAWRAKQHAIALLWGDWKESYAKIPRVLRAMNHFNPGVKWFPYMTGLRVLEGCVLKPVLLRVFLLLSTMSSGFPTLSSGDTCRRHLRDRQVQRHTHDGSCYRS
jgi:hypothetical protein